MKSPQMNLPVVRALLAATQFAAAISGIPLAVCSPGEQTVLNSPAFEVASIKPISGPGGQLAEERDRGWGNVTGKVNLRHIPLKFVLTHIYGLKSYQVSGPAWLGEDAFDILATVPAGASKEQIPLMFEALLAERFKFKFHRETRTSPVYALMLAEGGARLRDAVSETGADGHVKMTGQGEERTVSGVVAGPYGNIKMTATSAGLHNEFFNVTLHGLADYLSNGQLDLPVVDQTGLTGSYYVTLDISMRELRIPRTSEPADLPDAQAPVPAASDPVESLIRASLQKQGLKLVRRTAPIETLVIDHIERMPTEN